MAPPKKLKPTSAFAQRARAELSLNPEVRAMFDQTIAEIAASIARSDERVRQLMEASSEDSTITALAEVMAAGPINAHVLWRFRLAVEAEARKPGSQRNSRIAKMPRVKPELTPQAARAYVEKYIEMHGRERGAVKAGAHYFGVDSRLFTKRRRMA